MMRGARMWALAVRRPSGEIYLERHRVNDAAERHRVLRLPLVRGVWALGDALAIGMRALTTSANQSIDDSEEQLSKRETAISLTLAVAFFLAVFIFLPNAGLAWLLQGLDNEVVYHVIEGFVRVGIFLGYLAAISAMSDIKRVFAYHGGEHKTIAAWEHGEALEPSRVQPYSTLHVRCGTNFLLLLVITAIFVYTVVGSIVPPPEGVGTMGYAIYHIVLRIVLLPVVAGVAYEGLRLGAGTSATLTRLAMKPGLWLQKITTRPPDDAMVEVAIRAFQAVVPADDLAPRVATLPSSVVWGRDDAPADVYATVGVDPRLGEAAGDDAPPVESHDDGPAVDSHDDKGTGES
jgi:uncharacterized protein YqhQ